MSIEQQIRSEIYRAVELLGGDPKLLATVGSGDDEVLHLLKGCNDAEKAARNQSLNSVPKNSPFSKL